MQNKICNQCGLEKDISEFYKNKQAKDGHRSICKACDIINSPLKGYTKSQKRWYKTHKNKVKNNALLRTYGISLDDYNRLFEEQQGCCAICDKHQTELSRSLAVDHNHNTGKIRGLLCHSCNVLLGHAYEDVKLLKRAIDYVK